MMEVVENMDKEKIRKLVYMLVERGHDPKVIQDSYLQIISTDEEIESVIDFLNKNPNATKADVNYNIHLLHLHKRGILI